MTLELGEGFRLGEGKNRWSNVHVGDLGELIGLLVGAAVEEKEVDGIWGKDVIYFPENGAMVSGLSRWAWMILMILLDVWRTLGEDCQGGSYPGPYSEGHCRQSHRCERG